MAVKEAKQRREYTDAERATGLAAIEAAGGDITAAANACGVPRKTLSAWWNGKRRGAVLGSPAHKAARVDMASALTNLAWKLIRAGRKEEKIEKAGLSQIMVSIGIAIDKAQLLRSMPTKITATGVIGDNLDLTKLNDQELGQLESLMAKCRADNGQPGQPVNPPEVNGSTGQPVIILASQPEGRSEGKAGEPEQPVIQAMQGVEDQAVASSDIFSGM